MQLEMQDCDTKKQNTETSIIFFSPSEILEQSWRSFSLHLLPRSGLSAHHHRVSTQRLQGKKLLMSINV